MSRKFSRLLTLCGLLPLIGASSPAWGQVMYGDPCACPQPIQVQACYRQIPVTEYRECRHTVQRPVIETSYVDQPCTEYRQVVENKTCEVPVTTFQTVTECRPITRDCGHWVTQYHQRPCMTACQYDGRPDLFGFLNRTGYSLRMAFTPQTYAERVYVPNVITQNVPFQRQVAVQSSRTMNYQVSKVIPITTTRKVAVNTVRMVAQEIVTQHPVTVMKTVPAGVAYGYGGFGGYYAPPTTTAVVPVPPTTTGERTTVIMPRKDERSAKLPAALNDKADVFEGDTEGAERKVPVKRSSFVVPQPNDLPEIENATPIENRETRAEGSSSGATKVAAARPTVVNVGRWVARKPSRKVESILPETEISVADKKTRR